MTTIASSPLTDALQALVDARLDTIDRMLIGRVDRQDRLAIVREVESQVFDLLRRHDGPLDRDEVLAVLARLDPPEAYLPDEETHAVAPRPARVAAATPTVSLSGGAQAGRLDLASGVLAIISMLLIFFGWMIVFTEIGFREIGEGDPAEIVFLGSIFLTFVTGLLAVVFAAMVRLRGAWALVGLVNGSLSLMGSIGSGIWFLGQL